MQIKVIKINLLLILVLSLFSFSLMVEAGSGGLNQALTTDRGILGDLLQIKANIGPMTEVMWLNLDQFNRAITSVASGGFAPFNREMVMYGVGGVIGLRDNLRFGGYVLKGGTSSSRGEREAELNLTYGGILCEKGVYSRKGMDIAVGGLLGVGQTGLDLIYAQPTSFPGDPVTR